MSLMVAQPKIEIPRTTTATAAFDPPVVRPGEWALLRVTLNALEESVEWPTNLAGPPRLEIRPGAHQQILQMTGPNMEPRMAFNYRVRSSSLGSFTVPEFVIKVDNKPVTVPSTQLEVVSQPPATVPPAMHLTLELPVTNLFVGQAVQARIALPPPPGSVVLGLVQAQLSGPGLLVDLGGGRQRFENVQHPGGIQTTFIYETTLTPMVAGKLAVLAQGFTPVRRPVVPMVNTNPAVAMQAIIQYTLVESEPVELNVRPLPHEGELPGFTGAIGTFGVGPPRLATTVLRVGDPVGMTVTITNRSDAPLARLVAPPPPQAPDWQVFAATDFAPAQPIPLQQPVPAPRAGAPPPAGAIAGVVTFNYILIPLTEAARATPPIPFSCFDPKSLRYVDLTIPSMAVTVNPGAAPGNLASLQQAAAVGVKPDKEPGLSGLAASPGWTAFSLVPPQRQSWFPVVQLAPAVAFFGLWRWDRRRRYLEQHPDIVLRRRARRALRRQRCLLRRAARAADAHRFATAAVSALRVACAPHYPAEPGALVGSDVLPLLPESDRSGRAGEVVRRFFAVTDAARFSTAAENGAELLSLQPDLERVLQQLEERL